MPTPQVDPTTEHLDRAPGGPQLGDTAPERIAGPPAAERSAAGAFSGLRLRLTLDLGLGAVAVAAALVSGVAVTRGDRLLTVLPLALLVGLAVGALALTRFRDFILLLLAIRPSIDLVKLSG
ncbi:MAG: hypothetical protein ACRCXL_15540, partial [Dermatophilaceae bacterium]